MEIYVHLVKAFKGSCVKTKNDLEKDGNQEGEEIFGTTVLAGDKNDDESITEETLLCIEKLHKVFLL